jgi:hypothetical protein
MVFFFVGGGVFCCCVCGSNDLVGLLEEDI